MELSEDEIHESAVESRELDLDARVKLSETDDKVDLNSGDAGEAENSHSEEGQVSCEEVAEVAAAAVYVKAELKDELAQSDETLSIPQVRKSSSVIEEASRLPTEEQLAVSDEYLESIKQIDQTSNASRGKGGGKWKKRRRRNPFISFFLSMYSRRPRQRVVEVARQAGRHWGRMSDSQRKLYANLQGFQH